jgi:hypothetical protein
MFGFLIVLDDTFDKQIMLIILSMINGFTTFCKHMGHFPNSGKIKVYRRVRLLIFD